MSYGLKTTIIDVRHKIASDDYFGGDTDVQTLPITCLVGRVNSAEEQSVGVASASNLIVVLHVVRPVTRVLSVKDTFAWHGNTYRITAVDDGIQDENAVKYTPFRWSARAESINGIA